MREAARVLTRDERLRSARCVVTDRLGGTSAAPYDTLNLALHTGDGPDRVRANRDRLSRALGLAPGDLVFAQQVHGTGVQVVSASSPRELPATDALVTTTPGLALVIMGADCLPVLLVADGVVGAAHVGRAGLAGNVVAATLGAMRAEGAGDVAARIGPGICGRCYEVPAAMADEVETRAPGSRATTRDGATSVDLTAGVRRQLADSGVTDVEAIGGCTYEEPDRWFSYRRDGVTGRHAGVVLLT